MINRINSDTTTALMQAVIFNRVECVRLLLEFGGKIRGGGGGGAGILVNIAGKDGTALDLAIQLQRHITICDLLEKAGAKRTQNVNYRGGGGSSPSSTPRNKDLIMHPPSLPPLSTGGGGVAGGGLLSYHTSTGAGEADNNDGDDINDSSNVSFADPKKINTEILDSGWTSPFAS